MSHKKEISTQISEEETVQVQHLLEQYHHIVEDLQKSADQAQAEDALTAINALPEAVQIVLLKALAKENEQDAADVLLAVNALSPHKEVRKEARRALIRLEATKTYPRWTPPRSQAPAVEVNIAHPPRFWKGFATRSREEGEIQLLLCWEQGYDYSEVRMLSLLLDFWQNGVADVSIETGSKRRIDERITSLRNRLPDVSLQSCTLAEGKRLLQEAVSLNEWSGVPPAESYRTNIALINRLILQASDLDEDRGSTFITPELEDQEVVVNFLGAWSMGDYGLAYDLLTKDCALRNDLTRDEWIDSHRTWAAEAHPTRMELGFVHELENKASALWLPSSTKAVSSRKEIEVGWSLELRDTPLSGTLKEMPMGTAVNKETGRHWFWTSYTLLREQGAWRIQKIADEGLTLQGLTIDALQKRIKEHEDALDALLQQRDTNQMQAFLEEASWRLTQLLHFDDALITQLPLDQHVCEDAYRHAVLVGNPERIMIYLERMAQRFPTNRGDSLRRLASTLAGLAYKYDTPDWQERQKHLLARAEESIREAITVDHDVFNYILLGELLISENRHDEAETELLQAREMQLNPDQESSLEAGFGNIAMRREQFAAAIPHYRRVVEINPQYSGAWFSLGFAYRLLGNVEQAEASYQQALQVDADDVRAYAELTAIYMQRSESAQARALLEQGVHINPTSAHLHALLASVLFEAGDRRGAQRQLEEAESIDPDLEIVQNVRQHIHAAKRK